MSDYTIAGSSPSQAEAIEKLKAGKAPGSAQVLNRLTTGMDSLTEFLKKQYLDEYIANGGSKIKFVTGRPGSGKTHFCQVLLNEAASDRYLTVSFSAKDVWLHDFREIYLQILRQCDLFHVLQGCADQIIRKSGYDPSKIPADKTFMAYLSEKGEADPLSKTEIRSQLRTFFARNSLLDNFFADCCSLLTGSILGHPVLETASRDLILSFLHGDKTVKLSQMRALGLSPSRITKFNARHLLRSLAEVIHRAGYRGLLIVIDDMEQLLNRTSDHEKKYTKFKRDDTYESIRQLIDDIDNMHHLFFILSFDRELIDNDSYGLKSYQALWMRVQNEVVSTRFNRFADILDLDRYADECYSTAILMTMSQRLAELMEEHGIHTNSLNEETVEKLIERGEFGGLGLPYLVNRTVLEEESKHV